jgi:hypothetical protein
MTPAQRIQQLTAAIADLEKQLAALKAIGKKR